MVAFGSITADTDVNISGAGSGQELAYNQITALVAVAATSAATANLVIEGTSRTYDGSPVMVEFFAPQVLTPNSQGAATLINLWDGATDLGYIGQIKCGPTLLIGNAVCLKRRIVPTAGTHNYRIVAWCAPIGGGQINAGAGGVDTYAPAYVRVTRV